MTRRLCALTVIALSLGGGPSVAQIATEQTAPAPAQPPDGEATSDAEADPDAPDPEAASAQEADAELNPAEARWADRLAALEPDDPEAYFLLGEEVADRAESPEEISLARRLFVLAFELDRARATPSGLDASACIALASIERQEDRAAWLRALAGALDERYAATDWNVGSRPEIASETGLLAARVLGLTRSGHGNEAQSILDQHPEVLELLTRYDRMLGTYFPGGGMHKLREEIRYWPCPECGGSRVLHRSGTSPPKYRLCYTCHGNPGPQLTLHDLILHLRFESLLLSGVQRSWAAQVAVDFGSPLRDPEARELAPTMRVDPERVYWRDGEWLTRAGADSAG